MSKPVLTPVQEAGVKIKELNAKVLAIHDEVDSKQEGVATDDQKSEVIKYNKEICELEKAVADTEEWNASKDAADARKGPFMPVSAKQSFTANQTITDRVLGDEQFKNWHTSMKVGDNLTGSQFGHSPMVRMEGVGLKTLITGASATSAGSMIVNDHKPIVDQGTSYRPITIFDIITMGTTSSDVVEYVRQGTHTNAAAAVAEATATGDGTGGAPESTWVTSLITANVQSFKHFMAITRRALADEGQLRTYVDSFLQYGIQEEIEDEIFGGTGTSPQIQGLTTYSGTTAQAFDTDLPVTYRNARRKVKVTGRANPTAFVMHPTDWQNLDLLKDNEARYYYGGPSATGTPRLWGLPIVECEGATAGTAWCADWRLAVWWDRQQTTISVSDSHSDFFVRSMVAVMAEMRAAFDILRPAAFVKIALS